jgi:hypothetical protein
LATTLLIRAQAKAMARSLRPCGLDITQISRLDAEQITASLAARYWPPEAIRLPRIASAYPRR